MEVAPVQPQNGFVIVQPGGLPGGWTSCTLSPGQPNPTKSAGPPSCETTAGTNPINVGTGNKYEAQLDYMGSGPFPLVFERHYNSDINALGGVLLSNWHHTYDRYIVLHQGMTPPVASANRADGRTYSFRQSGSVWIGDQDVPDRLVQLFDASNTPTGWRYMRAQREENELYNAKGRLLSISNRAGLTHRLTYDASNRLSAVTDPFGRTLSLRYDADGRIAQLTDPAGRPFGYTYDANNNVSAVTYPDGKTRTYLYNEPQFTANTYLPGALTGIIDENQDRFATWTYDAQGRAVSSEHGGGAEKYAVTYPFSGQSIVTDPLGQSRTLNFQNVLDVLRTTSQSAPCGCGNDSTIAYDANGFVTSRTDFNGHVTKYQHNDPLGRVDLETSRTEAFGTPEARTITTEWDTGFRLPHRVAEPLRITTTNYDTHGNVLNKTIQPTLDATGALGFSASPADAARVLAYSYTYSATIPGHVTRLVVDGPRTDVADTTQYDWDDSGNLISITNALGHVTALGDYDPHGRAQRITDPNGLVTTLAYDTRGRITSRDVGGEVTSYVYDGVGQLKTLTLPDGSALSYTYDAAHRLRQIQDSLGNQIVYTLDAMGNRVQEQVFDPGSALAQTRSRAYDALNRLIKDIGGTNPLTQITQYGYDSQGNLTSVTDPLGHVTTNVYDALNRLKQVIDPAASGPSAGGSTQYAYDGLDQLTRVTDPRGLATGYTIDGLGNLTRLSSPDTGVSSSGFDAAGNLTSQLDPRGVSTSFTYDALNRLTAATYTPPAGSSIAPVAIAYTYDQGVFGLGRLTGMSDPSGSTAYSYDAHGRLTQDARTIGGVTHVISYGYDVTGRLTHIVYPSGRTIDYTLDALGRINQIDTSYQGTTQTAVSSVTYQPFGPVKSFTYGNALAERRTFDLDGRMASYSLGSINRDVSYDDASRITAFRHYIPANPALDQDFGYDNLNRLTSWSAASTSQSFNYDAIGNRTSQTIGAISYPYTYSAVSNQLTAVAGPSANSFQYDAAGNIQAATQKTFSYDARHRLIQASFGTKSASYGVNALGQRVTKTPGSGVATVYHYDSAGHLIAESDAQGNVQTEYIYLGDIPVAVIQ
jgi:YD repeat-containing protein